METLQWKVKIAVLWLISAVATSAHLILTILDPAAAKKGSEWAATASRGEWLFLAMYWFVPLWLSFVVVTMKDPANRWVNLVLAVVFSILNIWHFLMCAVPVLPGGPFEVPVAHHILLVGSTVLATALIAWYAWKWPPQQA